eukprot:scaffold67_cov155-Skeletonema_menzelii.AAC.5
MNMNSIEFSSDFVKNEVKDVPRCVSRHNMILSRIGMKFSKTEGLEFDQGYLTRSIASSSARQALAFRSSCSILFVSLDSNR